MGVFAYFSMRKKGFNGVYGIGRIKGQEVVLFEPLTYMNLSGTAVKAISSAHLRDKNDLLVVSDDVNLDLGRIRVREKGSAGGHNGLKSIIKFLGEEFARLRIGVGAESQMQDDMSSYVLASFKRPEMNLLNEAIERAVLSIETWVQEGTREAMNHFNG